MNKLILNEQFSKLQPDKRLTWHTEPASWQIREGQLFLKTEDNTDFWQKTHYGFSADNGHFLGLKVTGDFTMETRVHADYLNQYDQAGLMLRVSPECWIKTSIEFETEKENKLGVVVTQHGHSDWSTQNISKGIRDFSLRISRTGSDYVVAYQENHTNKWIQLRMLHLGDQKEVMTGLYACSPKKGGFTAKFQYLKIENGKS